MVNGGKDMDLKCIHEHDQEMDRIAAEMYRAGDLEAMQKAAAAMNFQIGEVSGGVIKTLKGQQMEFSPRTIIASDASFGKPRAKLSALKMPGLKSQRTMSFAASRINNVELGKFHRLTTGLHQFFKVFRNPQDSIFSLMNLAKEVFKAEKLTLFVIDANF